MRGPSPNPATSLTAYKSLGVSPADVAALHQITPLLREVILVHRKATRISSSANDVKIRQDPYTFLRASDDPAAIAVLDAHLKVPTRQRYNLPIEAYCLAAKVDTFKIFGIIVGIISQLMGTAEVLRIAVNRNSMVQKTIDRAMDDERPDALEHMEMFHKASGFLPTPHGTNISVSQNNQGGNAIAAAATVLEPPEQTIRRANDRFNEGTITASDTLLLPPPDPLTPHEQALLPPVEAAGDDLDDD